MVPSTEIVKNQSERTVGEHRDHLMERGVLVQQSGAFTLGALRGSLHSDLGPLDQDKSLNQDFALGYTSDSGCDSPWLGLAIADGVSTSYASEWAARLSCFVALDCLGEALRGRTVCSPHDLTRIAFFSVHEALQDLAEKMKEVPCPLGIFPSTWKYIIDRGRLLQTTLTLVWVIDRHLHLGVVGDGGAVYCVDRPGFSTEATVLARCDPTTNEVLALGPGRSGCCRDFLWQELFLQPGQRFLFAAYSDGVCRGLQRRGQTLTPDLLPLVDGMNEAKCYLQQAIQEHPKEFDDNLSLAVVRG